MIWFRCLLLNGLILHSLSGQEYVPDRIIVKLAPDISRNDFSSILDTNNYVIEKVLVRRLNIISIKLKNNQISPLDAIKEFRNNPVVDKGIPDTKVSRRDMPDDMQFDQQWALHNVGQNGGTEDADIDAPEAWDIATGGVTPLGDTIVVAIVDGGMILTHADLTPNLWRNWGELSGNGIDVAGNGYVDDVHGWNAYYLIG